jgi:hypothetical protein
MVATLPTGYRAIAYVTDATAPTYLDINGRWFS